MALRVRRDTLSLMYGAKYSENTGNTVQKNTSNHTSIHTSHGTCRGGDAHPGGGQAAVDAVMGPGHHS